MTADMTKGTAIPPDIIVAIKLRNFKTARNLKKNATAFHGDDIINGTGDIDIWQPPKTLFCVFGRHNQAIQILNLFVSEFVTIGIFGGCQYYIGMGMPGCDN
jgi:hypothetical protein